MAVETMSVAKAAELLGMTVEEAYELVFNRRLRTVAAPNGRRLVPVDEVERWQKAHPAPGGRAVAPRRVRRTTVTHGDSARWIIGEPASDDDADPGERTLRGDGYRFVAPVELFDAAFDGQRHLNNAAVDGIFNDLRAEHMLRRHPELGANLGAQGYVVAVREMHSLFESQVMPGERLAGGTRIEGRRGRAQIVEQRLVEESTGRPVARAWLVLLLLRDGRVVEWPDGYWDRVAELEGRAMPAYARVVASGFGPPPPKEA